MAAAVMARTGVFRALSVARRPEPGRVLLLGHHRVRPLPAKGAHRGDVELVSATPEEFSWQVAYLARHFEPVSCRQVADALDGRSDLPARAVAITFDDGYADFLEYALPILMREHVPATIFVATGYVGTSEPYWFDLVAQMLRQAEPGTVPHPQAQARLPEDASDEARARAAYAVLKFLKGCPDDVRVDYLGKLLSGNPAQVAAASEGLGRSMTWDQVREVHAGGVEIGAHSVTHPCLSRLDPVKLRREIFEPKQQIEAQLGVECPSLAYPFGGRTAFSPAVTSMAAEAGYRVGVSYVPGVNQLPEADRWSLLRQHVERYTSRDYFEALVSLPEHFQ